MSKHLLASQGGQVTPQADPVAIARAILTSHDAAELALAAIAHEVGARVSEKASLTEYPPVIVKARPELGSFPGTGFIDPLNRVRREFKHAGILPHVPDWYRVIESTHQWIGERCSKYLGADFEALDLVQLLEHDSVRELYLDAEKAHGAKDYRTALEKIGRALHALLKRFPRIFFPVIVQPDPHHALLLSAYGVNPAQFLTLQDFLPTIFEEILSSEVIVQWKTPERGHPANWTERNSRFCPAAFLDIALKIQHAPLVPVAFHFRMLFDNLIEPKAQDPVDLWQHVYDHNLRTTILGSGMPTGRKTVWVLKPGEKLRCQLAPSPFDEPAGGFSVLLQNLPKTIESVTVLEVHSQRLPDGIAYVEKDKVNISFEANDSPLAQLLLSD